MLWHSETEHLERAKYKESNPKTLLWISVGWLNGFKAEWCSGTSASHWHHSRAKRTLKQGLGGVMRLMTGSKVDLIDSSLQSSAGPLVGHSAVWKQCSGDSLGSLASWASLFQKWWSACCRWDQWFLFWGKQKIQQDCPTLLLGKFQAAFHSQLQQWLVPVLSKWWWWDES